MTQVFGSDRGASLRGHAAMDFLLLWRAVQCREECAFSTFQPFVFVDFIDLTI